MGWYEIECIYPSNESSLKNSPRGPIGLSALFTLCYWYDFQQPYTTRHAYCVDDDDEDDDDEDDDDDDDEDGDNDEDEAFL